MSAAPRGPAPLDVAVVHALAAAPDWDAALQRLVDLVASRMPTALGVGLTTRSSVSRAPVATHPVVAAADALQRQLGGPSVDVLRDRDGALCLPDVAQEGQNPRARWHRFAVEAVSRTPVRSVLSLRVGLENGPPLAALSVYSAQPAAFDDPTIAGTRTLVGSAAAALAFQEERRTRVELQAALASNRRIAAAVGIVMVREQLDYDLAFARLRTASQNANRKLHDVAEEVLVTGRLAPSPVTAPGPEEGAAVRSRRA